MTNEDKRNFINGTKLQYLQLNVPNTAANPSIGGFDLALKRRHGAKKQIA